MEPKNTLSAGLVGGSVTTATPQRVIPLLQALSRAEEALSALSMRLDPITNHAPEPSGAQLNTPSVTGRLQSLGDVLQYLLDNIEL